MSERFHEEEYGISRSDQGWALIKYKPIHPQVSILVDLDPQTDYHLVPVGDSGRHNLAMGCKCCPELIRSLSDGLVFRHYPFDNREQSPAPLINSLDHLLP